LASFTFACIGVSALGLVALWSYGTLGLNEPNLCVENPQRCFAHIITGEVYELSFTVHNRSGSDRKIIGAELT
jgi:hypothetical protein